MKSKKTRRGGGRSARRDWGESQRKSTRRTPGTKSERSREKRPRRDDEPDGDR